MKLLNMHARCNLVCAIVLKSNFVPNKIQLSLFNSHTYKNLKKN